MNKLTALLDGTTGIAFPFLFKLIRRYYWTSLAAVSAMCVAAGLFYLFQAPLYWTSIGFSFTSGRTTSPIGAIAKLVANSEWENNKSEILGIRRSVGFTRRVAERLLNRADFGTLNFNTRTVRFRSFTGADLAASCGKSRECLLEKLMRTLPGLYSVFDVDRSGVNFTLQVKAGDKKTAEVLVQDLSASIGEHRTEMIRRSFQDQIRITSDLISQKKNEIDASEWNQLKEVKLLVENRIHDLDEQIAIQNRLLVEQESTLFKAQAQVRNTESRLKHRVDLNALQEDKKRQSLEERVEQLTADIHALEVANAQYTAKDSQILEGLKRELTETKRQLEGLGNSGRSLSNTKAFIKASDQKLDFNELDVSVFRDQTGQSRRRYEELVSEKAQLLERRITVEKKLDELIPSIQFLGVLENKLVQLKLMDTSNLTDIYFDAYPTYPSAAKKVGRLLLLAYTVVMSSLALLVAVSIRFLTDDRIHDEDDLKRFVSKIQVLGNVPDFN